MANFKTHIAVSGIAGIGYGACGYVLGEQPLPTCVLAGGLCAVAGMMPDLDSGPGVPLRESMALAAAVIPMMLLERFRDLGLSHESMILLTVAVYLLIRFGGAELLRRFTTHRGMFHSLPAALIAAELGFLLASGTVPLRIYKAGGVLVGYVVHLLLDEIYSFEWRRGRLRLKRTFGTAIKLFMPYRWGPNLIAFTALGLLSYLVAYEPGWVDQMRQQRIDAQPEQTAEQSRADEARLLEALHGPELLRRWR